LCLEIRAAVDQLTSLVGSLPEFSQARASLRRVFEPVEDALERAIHTVRARWRCARSPFG